jgi:putative DNA methylase
MTNAMRRLATQAHSAYPVTIYYAFRQSESDGDEGTTNTGWDTFLAAVIDAGFSISGTWPIRTERPTGVKVQVNALASSIVLVCRPRPIGAPVATQRDFVSALNSELPFALGHLQEGNIAPVDLAQAAIGPGMAIYTRYGKVIRSDGGQLTVREVLALINHVLDEQLAEQEGDWDADTRWACTWFDQFSFDDGEYGQAEQLARAKNTAVRGVVEAGIALSNSGKVRLYKPEELPADWAPETDNRLTVWEMLHHLIRLQKQGEAQASAMLARLGEKADAAKELAYRLYGICEKKKRSSEGQLYNDLIVVWPDLVARSKEAPAPITRSGELNLDN